MKKTLIPFIALLLTGCWGNRFISVDPDLEAVFMGKSYYEIVDEFGRPDATMKDQQGGTVAIYDMTTLNGTSASQIYRQYNVRNRLTREEGTPNGSITFSFNLAMKCYAVESDFQREKAPKQKAEKAPKRPQYVKPRVPRELDFPYVKSRSPFAEVVSIQKVEVERDRTVVYFTYCSRTPMHRPLYDKGLSINGDVFIRDCETGAHIKLIKPDGITLYPEYTPFAHNRGGYDMLTYSLIFEALPLNTEVVDIIEPGPEGFNFYGVDVRTPMTFRQTKAANPVPESK